MCAMNESGSGKIGDQDNAVYRWGLILDLMWLGL